MLFTDPLWLLALFAAGAVLFVCPYPIRASRTNRTIAFACLAFAAANSATSYVRLDDDRVSARKMFVSQTIAWREVAGVEIVHRHGKYSSADWLQIGGRDGETIEVQVDNLTPARAAELATLVAKRLPADTAGASDVVRRLAPGVRVAGREAAQSR